MVRIPDWAKTAILVVVLLLGALFLYFACSAFVVTKTAMSNFSEAQRRAITSRVLSTQRMISMAIEEYNKDNGRLPAELHALTTPMAYLTRSEADKNFPDHFAENQIMGYFSWEKTFVVTSAGPDSDRDVQSNIDLQNGLPGLITKMYDATNGSISDGDVFRYEDGRQGN